MNWLNEEDKIEKEIKMKYPTQVLPTSRKEHLTCEEQAQGYLAKWRTTDKTFFFLIKCNKFLGNTETTLAHTTWKISNWIVVFNRTFVRSGTTRLVTSCISPRLLFHQFRPWFLSPKVSNVMLCFYLKINSTPWIVIIFNIACGQDCLYLWSWQQQ